MYTLKFKRIFDKHLDTDFIEMCIKNENGKEIVTMDDSYSIKDIKEMCNTLGIQDDFDQVFAEFDRENMVDYYAD